MQHWFCLLTKKNNEPKKATSFPSLIEVSQAISRKIGDCLQKVNNTILIGLDLNLAILTGFPCKWFDAIPIDVSNGRVDCDSWTTIIGPQHIWWENIIIIHNRLNVSLPGINWLGTFVSQDLNILKTELMRTNAFSAISCLLLYLQKKLLTWNISPRYTAILHSCLLLKISPN